MGLRSHRRSSVFAREVVSARYYGTRWEMDTFLAAATVPTILFGVFNGALVSALVPTFSEYLAHRKEDESLALGQYDGQHPGDRGHELRDRRFLHGALVRAADRPWVPGAADGRSHQDDALADAQHRRSQSERRALGDAQRLPSLPFRGPRRVAVNIVTIACVVLLNHGMGIYALVVGTALGLTAQMLVQLPAFLSIGKYRPIIDLHHPGLKKIWSCSGRSSSARRRANPPSFSTASSHRRWRLDTSPV